MHGSINKNWTHHSPNGINNEIIPAIMVIAERPVIQMMLKCESCSSLFVIFFMNCKKRTPHIQLRNDIYIHARSVVSIIYFFIPVTIIERLVLFPNNLSMAFAMGFAITWSECSPSGSLLAIVLTFIFGKRYCISKCTR